MICEKLISAYLSSLQGGFDCQIQPNGRVSLVTPYLYPDHDNVEVFIREKGNHVVVSDLGETLRILDTAGMDVCSTPSLLFSAKRIVEGFEAIIKEGVILKEGPQESIGEVIFDVISACKAVGSMIYGNRSYEPRSFNQLVAEYFEENSILAEQGEEFTGVSGTPYKTDFSVQTPKGKILIDTISPKTVGGVRSKVNKAFRAWSDIIAEYADPEKKITLLNDEDLKFRDTEIRILSRVSKVHRWTERQGLLNYLKEAA